MSQAELPLNPKEQKLKSDTENLDIKVRESSGKLKEESQIIKREKNYEKEVCSKITNFSSQNSQEITENLNKWYFSRLFNDFPKVYEKLLS